MKVCDLLKQCTLKIEYVPYMTVMDSGLEFDSMRQNEIRMVLGVLEATDEQGYTWTKEDLPLIEAHERAHLERMMNDNSIACFRAFCDMGTEGRIRQIKEEIACWKMAVGDRTPIPETLSKIQAMLNSYVFSHMKREEMY